MDDQAALALLAALLLAAVHLLSGRLRLVAITPRSWALSFFGGIAVAYVFAHLLPELAAGQRAVEGEEGEGPLLGVLEDHVWLMALLGLAAFYGVEQHSLASRRERRSEGGGDATEPDAFWLSIVSFAAYNAIVGYLLLRGELEDERELVLFTAALAVHFVVNDLGLREHHKAAYERVGRWVLAAAVLVGWAVGVATEVPERAVALVLAFIGGGVVLNVLKEELPGDREARFVPFLAGAVLYAALLQVA